LVSAYMAKSQTMLKKKMKKERNDGKNIHTYYIQTVAT